MREEITEWFHRAMSGAGEFDQFVITPGESCTRNSEERNKWS